MARANDIIISVMPGEDIADIAFDHGATVTGHIGTSSLYRLHLRDSARLDREAAALSADARVATAEHDRILGTEEVRSAHILFDFDASSSPGKYTDPSSYAMVHLGQSHRYSRGDGVVVAVLDTGAASAHPALKGHLIPGYNAVDPGSAPDDIPDGAANAGVGHGTMIAGLIARFAPGAAIMPVRVLNGDGIGTLYQLLAGFHYAIEHGANVISVSLGTSTQSDQLDDAVRAANSAGIVVVASAGNDDSNAPHYPAACPSVIAVASVETNGMKSPYSNYGSFIRVLAPGTAIRSTFWTGGYASWTGTSFSVPFVSAEAALVLGAYPQMTAQDASNRIRRTAHRVDRLNPAYRRQLGHGVIDIESAVTGSEEEETCDGDHD